MRYRLLLDDIDLGSIQNMQLGFYIFVKGTMPIQMFGKESPQDGDIILFDEIMQHITGKLYHDEIILRYRTYLQTIILHRRRTDIDFIKDRSADIADKFHLVSGISQ